MHVTVVDDRGATLEVYDALLAQIDKVWAKSFVSAPAALEWALHNDAGVLILDLRAPADCISFVKRYRAGNPTVPAPIIVITAEKDRETRHRALEAGANDYLTRPADPIEFIARVRNYLSLQESRQQLARHADSLTEEVARATKEIADREQETINRLVKAAEFRDSDTGSHIVRMGHYAAMLGKAIGLNLEEQRMLLLATPMHDVGKVATPDAVLLKPGKLTDSEWVIMKQHTTAGYNILAGSSSKILQLAAQIALGHHEKWDGSGYPTGRRGTDIPLAARIAMIGDVFDALISKRPYKKPWPMSDAFNEVKGKAGNHFDPMLTQEFLSHKDEIVEIAARFADDDEPHANGASGPAALLSKR